MHYHIYDLREISEKRGRIKDLIVSRLYISIYKLLVFSLKSEHDSYAKTIILCKPWY